MNNPHLIAVALLAALLPLTGCVRISTLRLVEPEKPGETAYWLVSKKSSLDTIVKTLRDKSEAPIVVSLDSSTGHRKLFTGSASGESWPEVFEDVLRQTGTTYTVNDETIPVFDVPKQPKKR